MILEYVHCKGRDQVRFEPWLRAGGANLSTTDEFTFNRAVRPQLVQNAMLQYSYQKLKLKTDQLILLSTGCGQQKEKKRIVSVSASTFPC